jgi:cytosine/adenosine deaminase-related metal-dependent hydrolase
MLIRAEHIITMDGEPLRGGAVRVAGDRILEIGAGLGERAGEAVIDLGPAVLHPGLINAHCHLDYTGFKGSIFPGKSFTEWIKKINAIKQSFSPDDYLEAIRKGMDMLLDSGCTTVLNIEAFPELLIKLDRPPLRVWWFLELIDVRSRMHRLEDVLGALSFFEAHPEWLGGFGLSPHAPYTSSIELYRLTRHCAEELGMPMTTHIAESREEQTMFLHGEGPLYEFLEELGRTMEDCGQGSALSHLYEFGLLPKGAIIVHANYLQDQDWEWITQESPTIVHCPKCHKFFGHQRFELERLTEAGCPILIGTDSLASNNTLDLRSELRELGRHYPSIEAETRLKMVTTQPAAALGLGGQLGVIRPGALADLVASPHEAADPYTSIIQSRSEPLLVMVNGELKRDPPTRAG